MKSGLIFDVKRYSINDGPGIRVTVFFKGCPMRCAWCHNPESISTKVQKMVNRDRCIGCNSCVEVCPEGACELTKDGIVTDRGLCTGCGKCADICPTKATEMSGRCASVEEIVNIVEKERLFLDQSEGGVTLSGGEPLLQPDFLIALLDELGLRSVHRAVDTTGFARTKLLLDVAERTDLFLYDLKVMDPDIHKKWTGVSNRIILQNLVALSRTGAEINIRFPLIKGINSDFDNIDKSAAFIASLEGPKKKVSILPYHNTMVAKHLKLDSKFRGDSMAEPSENDIRETIDRFTQYGLAASVGG